MTKKIITTLAVLAAATTSFTGCGCQDSPKGEMPIMAWYSIPASEFTLERFQELKDCGFNVNFTHLYNMSDLKKELDLGEQVGVKIMAMCNELYFKTDTAVNEIMNHPALYGYFLRDEPLPPAFPELAAWAERIKAVDTSHPIYLNLFPSYVDSTALGCNYREYVHRFIEEVKLPMVSFDNYPITFDGIRQLWYDNLQIIADESKKAGLPFWAFSLSTPHWTYPQPTLASIRIQQYTNLAYGAQGLQYFTYWTPGQEQFDYRDAPIDQNGKRSINYEYVQAVNKEIQARAGVFLGANVISVAHTGAVIPPHCPRLSEMPAHVASLSTSDAGAVVSSIENGKHGYLVVVNHSIDECLDLNVEFDTKVCMIDREGKAVKVARNQTSFTIEEGDVAIFRYKK